MKRWGILIAVILWAGAAFGASAAKPAPRPEKTARPEATARPQATARPEASAPPLVEDVAALGAMATASPDGPVAAAEALQRLAEAKPLTAAHLALAAEWLRSGDPFARALAEWAIALQVERDNRGPAVAWPRSDPPAWYAAWAALPADAFLEMDYARQAVRLNLHRDTARLAEAADGIIRRADIILTDIETCNPSPDARAAAKAHRQAIAAARERLAQAAASAGNALPDARRAYLALRRAARPLVLAQPAVDFRQIVFVSGYPGHSLMNITGSQYPWAHKPGGDIGVKGGLDPAAPVRGVLGGRLGPGHVHGIDLGWEGDRVVFGYARQPRWPPRFDTVSGNGSFQLRTDQEPTHVFEARLDGGGLRQITDHRTWSDFEPTYTAAGDVVFASDRSGRSSECGMFASDHTVINLYATAADGTGLRRLNDNKDIDRYPHSLDDGTIGYTRWDYQERHFFEIHSLWTVRPDGTMADAVLKQHQRAPYGLRDVRSVPGGPLLVAVGTGHHTLAYGPVMLADPTQGINFAAALRSVTPDVLPQEGPPAGPPVPQGGVRDGGGVYQTPWALSDRAFLASYSYSRQAAKSGNETRKAAGFALYLIDVHGNKELLHRDPVLSCTSPMPLKARRRPPVLPAAPDPGRPPYAAAYVADVYEGLPGVPRGTVRSIRILQHVGWPLNAEIGGQRWIPGNAYEKHFGFWSWSPVRVIGTAAVEADGSAHFKVPVDTAVYFQALDERQMEVRRMRSHVTFQRGEVRGCRGCHESQARTPADYGAPATAAMRREPETPAPPPWGARRLLGYEWLVQPVLDRHCVRCHGGEKTEAGVTLTAARGPDGFAQSFRTMFGLAPGQQKPGGRVLVSVADRFSGGDVTRVRQFGSSQSLLIQTLLTDAHKKRVTLADAEWLALVTWIDANAPYYDLFFNKRPADGGPPRREVRVELPEPFPAP